MKFNIEFVRRPLGVDGAPIDLTPRKGTAGSAGFDLKAALDAVIAPGKWVLVPCGFIMELWEGWEAQVRPRSGLALKKGVTVLNSPGTIDSDYRGEVGVILINHSDIPFVIAVGDRIAQIVPSPVAKSLFAEGFVSSTGGAGRGAAGFGSTGV